MPPRARHPLAVSVTARSPPMATTGLARAWLEQHPRGEGIVLSQQSKDLIERCLPLEQSRRPLARMSVRPPSPQPPPPPPRLRSVAFPTAGVRRCRATAAGGRAGPNHASSIRPPAAGWPGQASERLSPGGSSHPPRRRSVRRRARPYPLGRAPADGRPLTAADASSQALAAGAAAAARPVARPARSVPLPPPPQRATRRGSPSPPPWAPGTTQEQHTPPPQGACAHGAGCLCGRGGGVGAGRPRRTPPPTTTTPLDSHPLLSPLPPTPRALPSTRYMWVAAGKQREPCRSRTVGGWTWWAAGKQHGPGRRRSAFGSALPTPVPPCRRRHRRRRRLRPPPR